MTEISNKKLIIAVTKGIIGTITDMSLYMLFLTLSSVGKTGSRGVHEAFREADKTLEVVNHQTIARAFENLRKKNLIKLFRQKNKYEYEITKKGLERINNIIPVYDKKRLWDEHIYLVTYDISTKNNTKRNTLRNYLQKIGCAPIAESVYISPYNPKKIIEPFISNSGVKGIILVTNLGKDSSFGDEDLKDLLSRVYKLPKLNNRYEEFINKYQDKTQTNQIHMNFDFYSILNDDPQLPFALLPKYWKGNQAYSLFNKLSKH